MEAVSGHGHCSYSYWIDVVVENEGFRQGMNSLDLPFVDLRLSAMFLAFEEDERAVTITLKISLRLTRQYLVESCPGIGGVVAAAVDVVVVV